MQNKKSILTASMVLGILSAIMMVVGMSLPILDISCFYEKADFQYNLYKICKNIGLISSMWRAIPVGIWVAAALMLVLSFVKIPVLKILPCLLAIAMILLMIIDIGNVVDWIKGFIAKYIDANTTSHVDAASVFRSLKLGVYVIILGVVLGLISCFMPSHYEYESNDLNNPYN